MGEMSDGDWPVTIVPPKDEKPAEKGGKEPEPPEYKPLRKVKEPPRRGE